MVSTLSEPTDGECTQVYRYYLANKFLNQRELAKWYVVSSFYIQSQTYVIGLSDLFTDPSTKVMFAVPCKNSMKTRFATCGRDYTKVKKAEERSSSSGIGIYAIGVVLTV